MTMRLADEDVNTSSTLDALLETVKERLWRCHERDRKGKYQIIDDTSKEEPDDQHQQVEDLQLVMTINCIHGWSGCPQTREEIEQEQRMIWEALKVEKQTALVAHKDDGASTSNSFGECSNECSSESSGELPRADRVSDVETSSTSCSSPEKGFVLNANAPSLEQAKEADDTAAVYAPAKELNANAPSFEQAKEADDTTAVYAPAKELNAAAAVVPLTKELDAAAAVVPLMKELDDTELTCGTTREKTALTVAASVAVLPHNSESPLAATRRAELTEDTSTRITDHAILEEEDYQLQEDEPVVQQKRRRWWRPGRVIKLAAIVVVGVATARSCSMGKKQR